MGHSQFRGAGVRGAARKDSQAPCSKVASLIALASVGKGGDEVSPPRHIRGWGAEVGGGYCRTSSTRLNRIAICPDEPPISSRASN